VSRTIFTVGHSTRTVAELVALLPQVARAYAPASLRDHVRRSRVVAGSSPHHRRIIADHLLARHASLAPAPDAGQQIDQSTDQVRLSSLNKSAHGIPEGGRTVGCSSPVPLEGPAHPRDGNPAVNEDFHRWTEEWATRSPTMSPDQADTTEAGDEYDHFADIYSVWTDTAASTRANREFYLDAYAAQSGPVVELGIGDGRIAVEAATRGATVIGVDRSEAMLDLCRSRARQAGVLDRITLLQADFRSFRLGAPAALIALPYHSIGHLMGRDEKRAALRHVCSQLARGGRFIFDDFLMTPALMAQMRRVELRAEYRLPDGADALLWVTSLVNERTQSIRLVTWEDELDEKGLLVNRRYRRLGLSWIEPAEAKGLIEEAGFSVEACFGDFLRTPFAQDKAQEQVWVLRKPG
jgi:SAM-dependent methyltransferase